MNVRNSNVWLALMAFWVSVGLSGCTGGQSDQPDIGTVEGLVTLDGEPLPEARVIFQPDTGRPSLGVTDEEGHYVLQYTGRIYGAKVGKHTVSISTYQEEDAGIPYRPEKVPAKYNVETELTKEVKPGSNEINFALDSEGEIVETANPNRFEDEGDTKPGGYGSKEGPPEG